MGRALATLILLIILVPGCGSEDDQAPTGPITYSRSGGIAGIGELLEIKADGRAKLTVGYGPDAIIERFELSEPALDELVTHLEEVDFEAIDEGASNACADCFVYELSFGDERASSDDVTLVEGFSHAADPLAALAREHAPRAPTDRAGPGA